MAPDHVPDQVKESERLAEVECPDCRTRQRVKAPRDARDLLYFWARWSHPSGRRGHGCLDGCQNSTRNG